MIEPLERLGIFARPPDARTGAQIAADVDDEITFHLAEGARELERDGFAPDAACAEARRRFGNVERVRRACVRTQMGERIMVQRIQLVLTAALLAAVCLLAWSTLRSQAEVQAQRRLSEAVLARLEASAAAPAPSSEAPRLPDVPIVQLASGDYFTPDGKTTDLRSVAEAWKQRFYEDEVSWRHGLSLAGQLVALSGTQGAEILAQIWPSLSVAHREQAMKPFGGHPAALEVLDLGVRDGTDSVRQRALVYLRTYAWQDLAFGEGAAEDWMVEWRDRPVADVLQGNARRWGREVRGLLESYDMPPEERIGPLLAVLDHLDLRLFTRAGVDLVAILREEGLCERLATAVGACEPRTRDRAHKLLGWCTMTGQPR